MYKTIFCPCSGKKKIPLYKEGGIPIEDPDQPGRFQEWLSVPINHNYLLPFGHLYYGMKVAPEFLLQISSDL